MSEMSENVRKCPKNKMSEMSDIPKNVKSDMDIFGHFRTFSDIFKIFFAMIQSNNHYDNC